MLLWYTYSSCIESFHNAHSSPSINLFLGNPKEFPRKENQLYYVYYTQQNWFSQFLFLFFLLKCFLKLIHYNLKCLDSCILLIHRFQNVPWSKGGAGLLNHFIDR